MNTVIYIVIRIALLLAFSICLATAVNTDCKINNIKNKGMFTDLAFFLGFIGLIIYLCKRKTAQRKSKECTYCRQEIPALESACPYCGRDDFEDIIAENSDKMRKKVIALLIAAVIAFVGSNVFSYVFDDSFDLSKIINSISSSSYIHNDTYGIFYDKYGNEYSFLTDVAYYDRNENEYYWECEWKNADDNTIFLSCQETGDRYNIDSCYIDEDGYLFFDADEELVISEKNDLVLVDSDGHQYYYARYAGWRSDGSISPDIVSESD
ncbi:MAG: hypothetical protein ACLUFN_00395 [Eubacterium sp.]